MRYDIALSLEVGAAKRHRVDYQWSQMLGTVLICVDGRNVFTKRFTSGSIIPPASHRPWGCPPPVGSRRASIEGHRPGLLVQCRELVRPVGEDAVKGARVFKQFKFLLTDWPQTFVHRFGKKMLGSRGTSVRELFCEGIGIRVQAHAASSKRLDTSGCRAGS